MNDRKLDRWLARYRDRRDVAALGRLFDATAGDLLRLARHLVRDEAEAEDLVQATFLALLEHPERYDDERPAGAWMAGILTREAKLAGRRAARRADPERAAEGARVREEASRPSRVADGAEGAGAVRTALGRVPELYRAVLERHLLGGEDAASIAAATGSSAGAVRVQLHRGLAHLRRRLPHGLAWGAVVCETPQDGYGVEHAPRGLEVVRAELMDLAKSDAGAVAVPGGVVLVQKAVLVAAACVSVVALVVWRGDALDARTEQPMQREEIALHGAPAVLVRVAADETSRTNTVETNSTALEQLRARMRLRTVFADGTPAPNVAFLYESSKPDAPRYVARTDEHGIMLFEGFEPGSYTLYGDRGGHHWMQVPNMRIARQPEELTPKEHAELVELFTLDEVWTFEPGHDLAGRVVDADGRPVANAVVWVSTGMNRESGFELARTDMNGRFAARQLATLCFVGARAEGFAPSTPVHVEHLLAMRSDGSLLECELVLPGPGVRVRGTVVDPAGAPVAGARLRIGAQDSFDVYGPNGVEGPPPPIEVVSDAAGAFEASGIAPGRVGVACITDGHPVQLATIDVQPGGLGEVHLRLEPASWVQGRLVDGDGVAVPNLRVLSARRNEHMAFREPMATSAPDGSFTLGPFAPGEVAVYARSWDGDRGASEVLQVAANTVHELVLVLADQPAIRGRALDVDGSPLAEWTVTTSAMSPGDPPPRAVFTNADGSFEIFFPTTGRVRLALYPAEEHFTSWATEREAVMQLDDVPVPSEDVLLVPDRAHNR